MNGLYVLDSNLIVSGEKTAIPTPAGRDLAGAYILLVKGEGVKAVGVIKLGEANTVTIDGFDDLFEAHRVSRADRRRWWPTVEEFNIHDILECKAFECVIPVELRPGVNMIVSAKDCGVSCITIPDLEDD